jgi:hypothetical protein
MMTLYTFQFHVNLLTFLLEPKLSKPLETTVIQFTSGHIPEICSPDSQTFITLPFLYTSLKRLLPKRFHQKKSLCICFPPILSNVFSFSQCVRSNDREQKQLVRFAAVVVVCVKITGSEVLKGVVRNTMCCVVLQSRITQVCKNNFFFSCMEYFW